ncbi:prenyltransferase/squalene oxidase repeat-containing protein [Aggregatilinea lenta]|uniref:prenyltransferase/squalene oxidase repeat-containing protein n=1 Tax=Aggregatilinea lenta TaxID=913108 RepID=UPI0019311489|nr:prenyltransferase/squalene oxidase repeat-containing protein [Aggregatilinea lenta]
MLGQREKTALRMLVKGTPIEKGSMWLINNQRDSDQGVGWPHLNAHDVPTVWGGTLDGMRALLATGVSRHDPVVRRAYEWLLQQQRPDGGFGSREVVYSAVEATAWVLITMRQMEVDLLSDPNAQRAVAYLEESVTSSGEVGTSKVDPPRLYPSMLTLWALHGVSEKSVLVARYLKDSRDTKTGGWGIRADTAPNPLSTAHVLDVLISTGHLNTDDVITKQATGYLLDTQKEEGNWDNFSETWFSKHQSDMPLRCDEYTTAWALIALLRAGSSPSSLPLAKAISWLVYEQKEAGYWLYNPLDDAEHIWCVSDSIVALHMAKERLIQEMTENGLTTWGSQDLGTSREGSTLEKNISKVWTSFKINLNTILLMLLAVFVFKDEIRSFADSILQSITDGNGIISDIVANAIYAVLVIAGTFIINRIRTR